MMMMINTRVI